MFEDRRISCAESREEPEERDRDDGDGNRCAYRESNLEDQVERRGAENQSEYRADDHRENGQLPQARLAAGSETVATGRIRKIATRATKAIDRLENRAAAEGNSCAFRGPAPVLTSVNYSLLSTSCPRLLRYRSESVLVIVAFDPIHSRCVRAV